MVYLILVILGLCFGSFTNAFVWRLHEHKNWLNDRSECINCHHKLGIFDLFPILSWLYLKGRCRYCHKKISIQYPIVEAIEPIIFVISYIFWPNNFSASQIAIFSLWLIVVIGLTILALYDLKWMLLPTRLIYCLYFIALTMAVIATLTSSDRLSSIIGYVGGFLIGGGLFYLLFQLSKGKWIGGGDVRLGFLLGLIVGTVEKSFLLIFLAAIIGTLFSLPLIISGKYKRNSLIPFGPFLILSTLLVVLFGSSIIHWYGQFIVSIH